VGSVVVGTRPGGQVPSVSARADKLVAANIRTTRSGVATLNRMPEVAKTEAVKVEE
jgi:hypothetical protein